MAIPLALLSAIPGLLSGGYKAIAGAKQVRNGKAMAAGNIFQKYHRPGEANLALKLAEEKYRNGRLPGAGLLENQIDGNASAAMAASTQGASSGADVLDAASKINNNSNNAMNQLAMQSAAYKDQALAGYTQQLQNQAGYADKEFQYNVAQPYERTAAAASALIGAGNTNVFSGVDEGMGTLTDAMRMGIPEIDSNMGMINGSKNINVQAGMAGVTNTMGGAPSGTPVAGSPFVTQPSALQNRGFTNPALSGKWIVDPTSGTKRWAAN